MRATGACRVRRTWRSKSPHFCAPSSLSMLCGPRNVAEWLVKTLMTGTSAPDTLVRHMIEDKSVWSCKHEHEVLCMAHADFCNRRIKITCHISNSPLSLGPIYRAALSSSTQIAYRVSWSGKFVHSFFKPFLSQDMLSYSRSLRGNPKLQVSAVTCFHL